MPVSIYGDVDGIFIGLDFGTELGSLDEYFDGFTDGELEVLLLGDSMVSTDGEVIGPDKGIDLLSTYDEVLGTILGNLDGITLGIDVGTGLESLDIIVYGYKVS